MALKTVEKYLKEAEVLAACVSMIMFMIKWKVT